jgi:hypothetical protein
MMGPNLDILTDVSDMMSEKGKSKEPLLQHLLPYLHR